MNNRSIALRTRPAFVAALLQNRSSVQTVLSRNEGYASWEAAVRELGADWEAKHAHELRALQADLDTAGGYTVTGPLLTELLRAESEVSQVRRLGRVLEPTTASETHIPAQEALFSSAEWTFELDAGQEMTLAPFGARRLAPYPLARLVRVSNTLLRNSAIAEQTVMESLAEAAGVPEEAAFIQGSGSGEPLGILASAAAVPSVTTVGAGALAIADIKRWLFALPARYQADATILCNVDFMSMVAALDVNGALGLRRNEILGYPVALSDQFPSAGTDPASITNGAPLAVIGDFRWYWIQDADFPAVQRSAELYAETNETAFFYRREIDGMPVLPGAFRILKAQ